MFSYAIMCAIYEYVVLTKWALNPYGTGQSEGKIDYEHKELIQFGQQLNIINNFWI